MKLIAQVKLLPTPEQYEALKHTLETANAACNAISDAAWEHRVFRQFSLHKLVYRHIRERFGLSAQLVVRLIAKVADAYKLDRATRRTFKPLGSIAYDDRILSWNPHAPEVSIWTVAGRERIPFAAGERQHELLKFRQGETDLVYHRGTFYLLATCNVEEPDPATVDGVLGIDLGIVNIATDSDGEVYSGKAINNVRHRHRRLRRKLQRQGTKAARRRLKKLSGKERRFARNTNHTISKRLVARAQDTNRAIALEDLTHLRSRVTVRRRQRATLHSWSFSQLRQYIEYKARLAGVPVVLVDPRNTSRTCPACGQIDKRNRPSQSIFSCTSCGYAGFADYIAAENIRRAAVNRPNVSDTRFVA